MAEAENNITTQLERSAEEFYSRMDPREAQFAKVLAQNLYDYVERVINLPFLIAGVGGILRFDDPAKARDIDLVAVGLKYAPVGRHNFDHVEEFTGIVNTYFDRLVTNLISQGVDVTSFIKLRSGSGPFKDHNKEFKGKLRMIDLGIDLGVEVKSDLDSFGCYNSKGLQIVYEGLRPVDIQFSFNMTPGDWKQEQVRLTDIIGSKLEAKSREFPYAVLLERQESQRDV